MSILRGAQCSAPLRENTTTYSTQSNLSRTSIDNGFEGPCLKWGRLRRHGFCSVYESLAVTQITLMDDGRYSIVCQNNIRLRPMF